MPMDPAQPASRKCRSTGDFASLENPNIKRKHIMNTTTGITVRNILEQKTIKGVYSISPEQSTYEALQIMAKHDIGAVAVMENGKLVGIISERHYSRHIALEGKSSHNTPVKDIMRKQFYSVTPDTKVNVCMRIMTEKRRRYLAVMEEDTCVGIISIGDLMKAIIDRLEFDIDQLVNYITAG